MAQIGASFSFVSFLWLPASLFIWAGLSVWTFLATRRQREDTGGDSVSRSWSDSVSGLSSAALWLAILLTLGGAATVLASGPLADAGLTAIPLLAVVVLDVMTALLVAAFVRILVLVLRRGARPGVTLAWAYAVTFAGVVMVLVCIAAIGLPHLEGGIGALLT